MGKLIYMLNTSVDGFVETADHSLDWSSGDDELLTWFAERARGLAASLYGRRLYEVMSAYWPTADADPRPASHEFRRLWLSHSQDRLLFHADLGRLEQPARSRRRR